MSCSVVLHLQELPLKFPKLWEGTSLLTCNEFEYNISRDFISQTISLNLENMDSTISSSDILNNSYSFTSEPIQGSFTLMVPS